MRTRIPGVMRAVQATAWAIVPEKLDAMLDMLELRASGVAKSDEEIKAVMGARRDVGMTPKAGSKIAVLPLYGCIAQRANMMTEYSGGTSTEQFAASFDAAMASADVGAIVIDCDSPGGSVQGVTEMAARVRAARGKGKSIIAVANTMMASAAYWICAQADEIVAAPSSMVGSIGVFMCHTDESEADAKAGLKRTFISAGRYKTEGNSAEPLSAEALAAEQAMVDEFYALFVNDVAAGRDVKPGAVEAGYGEGRCLPARQAKAAGLIDRVATLEQVLAELGAPGAGVNGKGRRASTERRTAASADVTLDAALLADLDLLGIAAPAALLAGVDRRALVAAKPAPDDDEDVDEDGEEIDEEDDDSMARLVEEDAAGADDDEDDDEEDTEARPAKRRTMKGHTAFHVTTGGAVATRSIPPASNRPHVASQEHQSMSKDTAPHSGASSTEIAAAVEAALKQRDQVNAQIRALAGEHGLDATHQADVLANAAGDMNAAAAHILNIKSKLAADSPVIRVGADREAERPFANLGEQLQSIVKSTKSPHAVDKRLLHIQAAASGMGEATPSDGGFAIQTDFSQEIIRRAYVVGQILSRVRNIPISEAANGLKINAVDETSRVTGSRYGGIQSYWANEADTVVAKKPKLRQMQLELRKLFAIWYLTDELMQDSTALGALATDAFSEEITFMTEDAILNGPGNGQPLGIFNSNAVVSVAKEAGQAAATFNANNAAKMLARLWARSQPSSVWLMNQDVLPQLITMTLGGATGFPVYMPPGGMSQAPYGTLLGRPIVPVEYAATLGTPGDIALTDLSQYLLIDKGGPQQAQSIHVRFLNDEMTFRITYRVDGQPIWNAPVTPKNGTNTLSPFITLQTR